MKYLVLEILNRNLGVGTKKKDNNYAFYCPFCGHHKKKLEFDLDGGEWHCWVCHEKGFTGEYLLTKSGASLHDIKEISSHETYSKKSWTPKEPSGTPFLRLPEKYKPFTGEETSWETKRLLNHLTNIRGLSIPEILKWKIGYEKDNIILPSYDRTGRLNYYSSKNITTGKYNNPEFSRDIIALDLFVNWNKDIILVEGFFDAYAVQRNVTPILSTMLGKTLKKQIVMAPCKNIYVCLDAGVDVSEIIEFITGAGKNAYKVELPGEEDPSSIGKNKIWDYINKAKLVTEEESFLQKLKFNL